MLDDIQDYDEQLQDLLQKVRTSLQNEVPKLTGGRKLEKIQYLNGRINRIHQVFRSYKTELRELTRSEARPFEEKAHDYEREIAELQASLDRMREQAEVTDSATGGQSVDQMDTGQIITVAKQVQQDSKAATERAKAIVEETIDIGTETNKTLHAQTEQLERIDRQVEIVDDNIKQARKQLRVFLRRVATDKIIMTMICLVVVGIIIAIITAAVKNHQNASGPQPTPTAVVTLPPGIGTAPVPTTVAPTPSP